MIILYGFVFHSFRTQYFGMFKDSILIWTKSKMSLAHLTIPEFADGQNVKMFCFSSKHCFVIHCKKLKLMNILWNFLVEPARTVIECFLQLKNPLKKFIYWDLLHIYSFYNKLTGVKLTGWGGKVFMKIFKKCSNFWEKMPWLCSLMW